MEKPSSARIQTLRSRFNPNTVNRNVSAVKAGKRQKRAFSEIQERPNLEENDFQECSVNISLKTKNAADVFLKNKIDKSVQTTNMVNDPMKMNSDFLYGQISKSMAEITATNTNLAAEVIKLENHVIEKDSVLIEVQKKYIDLLVKTVNQESEIEALKKNGSRLQSKGVYRQLNRLK